MRKCIAVALIVVILSSLCICVYAENITELEKESNEITQALTEANNRLQAVQEEISDNMQQLQELDNQIAQSQEELNVINGQVQELMVQITENEQKLAKVQEEYNNIQGLLDARLIGMYEAPELQFLQVIFEAKNVTEFLSTYYAMKELAECDAELLSKVKQQKQDIETTQKILVEKKKQINQNKELQQKKNQVLANTKTIREYYISKLSEEEKQLQTQIDEYNYQVSSIEAEIRLLAQNSISADYIGGTMLWPVPGYDSITSSYGMRVHPITGAYKLHTGIDIGAPLGTSFIASANGIVSKATFNKAYGNMVIIDHGGGVQTLYAHGNEILVQVGQIVSAGTEILKVGSTGYSTGPHAHFEIRINGQTVNPTEFLVNQSEPQSNTEESAN